MSAYDALIVDALDRLDPTTTALVVVDMQRYFVHPDYPFGRLLGQLDPKGTSNFFERVEQVVIPNLRRLLEHFRAVEAQIAFTEFGSLRQDGRDMPGWARRHNAMGRQAIGSPIYPPFDDPSCRVDDSVAPQAGDLVVRKSTSGPLNSSRLDQTFRVLGIDTIVVTGVVTDVCVAQTAREFGDRDFTAIVVEDACAAMDPQVHQAALGTIGMTFGVVLSIEKVLEILGPSAHAASRKICDAL